MELTKRPSKERHQTVELIFLPIIETVKKDDLKSHILFRNISIRVR